MVGGYNLGEAKTEIVSLTEGSTIPDCLDALSDYPLFVLEYAAGGALPDKGESTVYFIRQRPLHPFS